jgi:hypothetical protein
VGESQRTGINPILGEKTKFPNGERKGAIILGKKNDSIFPQSPSPQQWSQNNGSHCRQRATIKCKITNKIIMNNSETHC